MPLPTVVRLLPWHKAAPHSEPREPEVPAHRAVTAFGGEPQWPPRGGRKQQQRQPGATTHTQHRQHDDSKKLRHGHPLTEWERDEPGKLNGGLQCRRHQLPVRTRRAAGYKSWSRVVLTSHPTHYKKGEGRECLWQLPLQEQEQGRGQSGGLCISQSAGVAQLRRQLRQFDCP